VTGWRGRYLPFSVSEVGLDLDALQIESVLEVVNLVHHLVEHRRIVDLDEVDDEARSAACPRETSISWCLK
jgi:hypothetical protein